MPRKLPLLVYLAAPVAFALYLFRLDGAGLLGPDEPRYAAIARDMARTGDWVTPRLWGQPWFEKPVLLYWMSGAGYRLGMGAELAPRLPVALLSIAFLVFFWWILNREFGGRAAWLSALILGTSAGWVGYSQVGVTDLPLSATFSAAMLLSLAWIARRDTQLLPYAAAMLGLAALAKGLVPLVLATPLLLAVRNFRDLLRPRVVLPFLAAALPWYLLCYARNGWPFIQEFFVKHHFSRFASSDLQHVQPAWFYLPVLAGLTLPWAPLLALAVGRRAWADRRLRFLAAVVVFGLVFFSAATNKLPGYVLPLLPALAALAGVALDKARGARVALAVCALLLLAFVLAGPMLAPAVSNGLSDAPLPPFGWTSMLPVALAAGVVSLEARGRRLAAVFTIAASIAAGIAWLKVSALPDVDRLASARTLSREVAGRAADTCTGNLKRDWRYGLAYYLSAPLPECAASSRPLRLEQAPGGAPHYATPSN
jgi:4-amino-4-deoxy-L-arabinose transferase-like glycosyltransferase